MTDKLQGIVIALTTPFRNEELALDKLKENIQAYNSTGVSGYLALGTTGECVSLSDDESLAVVEVVAKALKPPKKLIIGATRESTIWTLRFIKELAKFDLEAVLIRPPSYFRSKMTSEALADYFLKIADQSHLPLIIYNIPQNTGLSLDPSLMVRLAEHPNILGLKESSGSLPMLGEIIGLVPESFHYFLGSAHVLLPGVVMGACGAILAVANAVPELSVEVFNLVISGHLEEARRQQLRLIQINKILTEKHGIAGLKFAQDLRGLGGGLPRSPLLPLNSEAKREISQLLEANNLLTKLS